MDDVLRLEDVRPPRERWVKYKAGEFLINARTPLERERFRRRVTQGGMARANAGGGLDINPGRELDYFTAVAEQYVTAWRNVEPAEYDPAALAAAMLRNNGLMETILRAITEDEDFREPAASAPTVN